MDQYFNQMEKIVKERKTSSRIRFMLQDVIDLRLVGTNSSKYKSMLPFMSRLEELSHESRDLQYLEPKWDVRGRSAPLIPKVWLLKDKKSPFCLNEGQGW